MKNKALMGLIATATIGTAIVTPVMINSPNTTKIVNKVLMVNNSSTNEAVVINRNSSMNLYALSNGSGIVSNLSTGEMLTILGQAQNGYCKVKVQETGVIGYISVANMQNILNGTNDTFTQLSGNGQVVNVSSNVRLRNNPAIGNNIIGHLTNGTSFSILGKQGQWYKVSVNGQTGFIYEEYVSTNIANNSVSVNSNNSNTSTTSSSSSNSTSNSNSSNHVKNIVVRTKSSITSNSSSNVDNTVKNNTKYISGSKAHINNKSNSSSIPVTSKNSSLNKDIYINQLKSIAKTVANIPKGETTAQMLYNGTKIYNLWNDELNNIYSKLKENLSASQFNNLQKSELNWINQKNASIKNLKQQGGSISAVNALNENIKITEARCYYLVNTYMN